MSELSIKLEGYREKVQRIADAIEAVFPGLIVWVQTSDEIGNLTISIQGSEIFSIIESRGPAEPGLMTTPTRPKAC